MKNSKVDYLMALLQHCIWLIFPQLFRVRLGPQVIFSTCL